MIKNTLKDMTQLGIWIQINQIYNTIKARELIQSYIIKANIPTNILVITIEGVSTFKNKFVGKLSTKQEQTINERSVSNQRRLL